MGFEGYYFQKTYEVSTHVLTGLPAKPHYSEYGCSTGDLAEHNISKMYRVGLKERAWRYSLSHWDPSYSLGGVYGLAAPTQEEFSY